MTEQSFFLNLVHDISLELVRVNEGRLGKIELAKKAVDYADALTAKATERWDHNHGDPLYYECLFDSSE